MQLLSNTLEDFLLLESLRQTSGIKQKDVPKTIEHLKSVLMPLLSLKEENLAFIGSAGKLRENDQNHNINLAIDINQLMEQNSIKYKHEIFEFLKTQTERLKYDTDIFKQKNRIVINWPINGVENNGNVEIHIQLSENLEWLKFIRFAPNLNEVQSEYTGKHREILLESIVRVINKKIVSYFKEDVVKDYERYELNFDEGLTKIRKSFEGKNGYLKTPRKLDEETRLITNNPINFIEIVFGENKNPNDFMTFEQCWEEFNSNDFIHKKKRNKIYKIFKNKTNGLGLTVPEGIM